jgi:hypothetical protein
VSILTLLSGSSFAVFAAEEPQPQPGDVQERGIIPIQPQRVIPQTNAAAAAAAAEAAQLDPKALLARIQQLEATVAQLQKALYCMDAYDHFGSSAMAPVLSAPHLGVGLMQVSWNGNRCP